MNKCVLVTYASATGSTTDVAGTIGKVLGERGFSVDVKPIQDNPSLENYGAIIIGSAVQNGRWPPQAVDFVKTNQSALNRVPVALFCVHIQNLGKDKSSIQNRIAYLDEVRSLLSPIDEGFFAGRFNRQGAALMLPKWIARLAPPLDFRNWRKIRGWAADLKLETRRLS